MLNLQDIDKTWTLFLDRDGVINKEKKNEYVLEWSEFIFMDGVLDSLKKLNEIFGIIVIVTNQKCIGKGLISKSDLLVIHNNMLHEINLNGGRIDEIYFCPDLEDDSPNRKPNAGMAFQAKKDFPEISFSKSIMVGNKLSDMQFGRNATMNTVFVATTNPEISFPNPLIDLRFNNLAEFTTALINS